MPQDNTGPFVIRTARLFELVDRHRAMVQLPPVDNTVKTTRLNLKFNITTGDRLDFSRPEITIRDSETLDALTRILNDQFRILLDRELYSLAAAHAKQKARREASRQAAAQTMSTQAAAPQPRPGLLKRLFGKRGEV